MNDLPNIQYLTHQQIDTLKWDNCIAQAENGLIYGYSFYLDAMSKNWDALVLSKGLHSENDYDAVMPLTWNKKFGIKYLYQPFFTAQLGVFGKRITEKIRDSFFEAIPSSFKYIDISLNSGNMLGIPPGFSIQRSNYTLDLRNSYENLYKGYNENTRRNIKKAQQAGCTTQIEIDVEKLIKLAVQQMKSQGNEEGENIERFRKLYQYLHTRQMATTYGIFSAQNELLASCVFFFSHNRAYYILVGNHPNGKTIGASHALIDSFIKDHEGKDLPTSVSPELQPGKAVEARMLLDFEGSDIPSLATFYRSFGAEHDPYPALKINRLPFYLKWMKK